MFFKRRRREKEEIKAEVKEENKEEVKEEVKNENKPKEEVKEEEKKEEVKEESKEEEPKGHKDVIVDYIERGIYSEELNIYDVISYLRDEKTYKEMGSSFTRAVGVNRSKKNRYYELCKTLYYNCFYDMSVSSKPRNNTI